MSSEMVRKIQMNNRKKEVDLQFQTLFEQSIELLRGQVRVNFDSRLEDMINQCHDLAIKMTDQTDPFVEGFKSLALTYKSGLEEFRKALLILQRMQEQQQEIKKIKIVGVTQENTGLLTEIKFSEKRLQRMRASVRLSQVLQESLRKKFNDVQNIKLQDIEPIPYIKDEEGDISDIFIKQRTLVDSIISKTYQVQNNGLDFTNKYQKQQLQGYFLERYKLANHFLGDDLIKEFLKSNQKSADDVNHNQSRQSQHQEKFKDLDVKNFIAEEDANPRIIQRIIKINQEIQEELKEDERQKEIEAKNQIQIMQKQNYWEQVLDKNTPIQKQRKVQSQQEERPKKKTIKVKPIISSLPKKTIFYQAHPNFPLINETYGQQSFPAERIKKSAIQYNIQKHPERQITIEINEPIQTSSQMMRTANTAQNTKSTSSNFFPNPLIAQQLMNRTNYKDFKSLTSLWGDKWRNY